MGKNTRIAMGEIDQWPTATIADINSGNSRPASKMARKPPQRLSWEELLTLGSLGNLYPTQMLLLMLAGFVLSRKGVHGQPSREQIEKTKKMGHQQLCLSTGQDFGFDVVAWFRYLLQHDPRLQGEPFFQSVKDLLEFKGYSLPLQSFNK